MKRRLLVVVAVTGSLVACGGDEKSDTGGPVESVAVSSVRTVSSAGSDVLLGVVPAANGTLWLSGHTDGVLGGDGDSPTGQDALVIGYDPSATDPVASIAQIGTDNDDAFLGVAANGDGGAVAVGYSKGDFGGLAAGINDIVAVAVDANGSERWRAQLGGPDWDRGYSVVSDDDGSVYVGGYTFGGLAEKFGGNGAGDHDAVVSHISADGQIDWVASVGSDALDWGQSMAIADDGVIIVGYTQGSWAADNAGGRDAFVTRLDSTGAVDWTVQLGSEVDDWLQGVTVLSDGSVLAVGFTSGAIEEAFGGTDILLVRVSADGKLQQTIQMGTAGDDRAFGVVEHDDGSVIISGTVSGDFAGDGSWKGKKDPFVAGLTAKGRLDWVSQFGSDADDDGYGIAVVDGSVWFVGVTAGAISDRPLAGPTDAWVARVEIP